MGKLKITREVKVGIMSVLAVFVLYFGLNFLKGVDIFSPISYYYAVYDNIGGLVPSSPVYVKGLKVGQVEEIKYDFSKEKSFTVKISISKDILVPEYTLIELYDDGLMGGKAMQLVYDPYANSTKMMTPGDTIPSKAALGLMGQLAGDLMPKIESIATQTDSLIHSVRKIVDSPELNNSLKSIEKASGELAKSSVGLKKLIDKDVPLLIGDVNDITGDLKVITTNLSKVDYASTIEQVDLTVRDLKTITSQITESKGSLGLLVNDKGFYVNLSNTMSSTNDLLIDLRNNPKKYVHFSLFGAKKE